jgi:ABC-type branched-subunit amino acid transport system ATPase component
VTLAVEITNRTYVWQQGRLLLSGPGRGLADDPQVIAVYLGARAEPPGETFQA